jgi:hypothetical protein
MKMPARVSKPEAEHRRAWVLEQLLAGRPRVDVTRETMRRWGVSESQAQKIVRQAVEVILSCYRHVDHEEAIGRAIHALEKALELAVQRGQPQEIVMAVRAMDQLIGMGADHQLKLQQGR